MKCGQWLSTQVRENEMLEGIRACEASKFQLDNLLGKSYKELLSKHSTEQVILNPLWKSKTELYTQAV